MPTATRQLSTADERREQVLEAAMRVFAERGYHGTATAQVASAAGISQAYLFKLFPTKDDLVRAVTERCFERTAEVFRRAAAEAGTDGCTALEAMGAAYAGMVTADPDALRLQLHAHAAAVTDAGVRAAVRQGFAGLYALVQRESGASDDEVRTWFASGMLLNVLAAMNAFEVDEPWARGLTGGLGG